jgi:hypothetical protein
MTEQTEVEVSRDGVKVRGRDVTLFILVAMAIGVGVLLYMLHAHGKDAREGASATVGAFKELTNAIKDSTSAQKEQTCMLRFEQKDRQANAEFCRNISR